MKRTTLEMRLRLLVIGLVLVVLMTTLVGRLFYIQGVKAEEYTEQARQFWVKEEVLKPKRGSILDRGGDVLAQETQAYTIAVYLPSFRKGDTSPEEAARQLAPLLRMSEADIAQRLSRKDVDQVELKTSGFSFKVSKDVKDDVMELGLEGVHAIPTTERFYLNHSLAAHVLGFLNNEGDPVKGVEAAYNELMQGKPGKAFFSQDRNGIEVASREKQFDPPVNGNDVVLTIDRRVQEIVEKALDEAVQEWSPVGATAIVMNPKNGEILAMANRPTYNPNEFYNADETELLNIATESVFEPGSTFKIITLAAALEEGKFHPDATYRSGAIEVDNVELHDWRPGGWGEITYAEGVQLSSNVAFVRLQQMLGKSFDTYVERFGFGPYGEARTGTPTGIDLNEESGLLPDPKRLQQSRLERATSSYGHGLSATPIQLVSAYSAAINGGTLYKPQLLKEVRHPETGAVLEETKPLPIRDNIISEETSRHVRELLYSVVNGEKGTGKGASVPGYSIGGKTGTANKYKSPYSYVSFVGFAPADDPEVILYVALDEPKSQDATGGNTVAPIARTIFEQMLPLLRIDPASGDQGADGGVPSEEKEVESELDPSTVVLPDVQGKRLEEAQQELKSLSLESEVLGAGDEVLDQVPESGTVDRSRTVYLLTEEPSAVTMPDLRFKSLREAMAICDMLGLEVRVDGEGYVYAQSIEPGARLLDTDSINLVLKSNAEIYESLAEEEEESENRDLD